jgi:hypothetical protein
MTGFKTELGLNWAAAVQLKVNQEAASSIALQEGEQTTCDVPSNLRVVISERVRCLPHRKQDIVAPPNEDATANGEPDALDL